MAGPEDAVIAGVAVVYGDNVDTDQIYPGRYLELVEPDEVAAHAMEGIDPGFPARAAAGAVVVAGRNFGCGSSREHAVRALKYCGVRAVVAESIARIFYRNCINLGLPAIALPRVRGLVAPGDRVEIDLEKGVLRNVSRGGQAAFPAFPAEVRAILKAGGLVPFMRRTGEGA